VRTVTQQMMNRLFEITDEMEIEREALTVPLVLEGEGNARRAPNGRLEITLPDTEDLAPFLATLPDRLRALGAVPGNDR
jgi:hypothetical protein